MKNASYIIYAKRTPFGNFGGTLSSLRVDDLLAHLLSDVKAQMNFDLKEIDDVIIGCANQAGEDNRNIARMSLLLAQFPYEVPGTTINRLCGSSLDAIIDAHARISSGMNECVIAGGAESMSRAPYVISKAQSAFDRQQKMYDTALGWRFPNPAMEKLFPLLGMGETAEEVQNVSKISRLAQDQFALQSHQKASANINLLKEEIIPIKVTQKKSETLIDQDEGIRADSTLEKLTALKPAFRKDGTVTAGNSSSLNDGASCVVICSYDFLKRHNLKPLAQVHGGSVTGLHPNIMGLGPVSATKKLLTKLNWKKENIDIWEFNEAFAIQVLSCLKELDINPEHVNKLGGSIALGHPLGASGGRLVTSICHQMRRNSQLKKSIATMCIGVGQGIAIAVENTN